MRSRDGFTLVEVLIVMILIGIVGGIAMTQVGGMLAQTRVQRAASVVAADLKLAHSLAGRRRQPVRISIDTVGRVFRVRDYTTPTTIYSQRFFHSAGEYPVDNFAVTVTLRAAGRSRVVTMSRAGQVRVSAP
jgi:prepilin-type N-terminal cleavage/methylation domain-containing protein